MCRAKKTSVCSGGGIWEGTPWPFAFSPVTDSESFKEVGEVCNCLLWVRNSGHAVNCLLIVSKDLSGHVF